MVKRLCMLFVVALFGCLPSLLSGSECSVASSPVRVDVRMDFGGRLAHGVEMVSPLATEADSAAALRVDGKEAAWSVSNPILDTGAYADGWREVFLREHSQDVKASLAFLNNPQIAVHGGALTTDEEWSADRIHVVRHWVRVPAGRTLTLPAGAIVKFCKGTGLQVDGTLLATGATFTIVEDDTVGGDTDMQAPTGDLVCGSYELTGTGTLNLAESAVRYQRETSFNLTLKRGWNLVSLPAAVPLKGNEAFIANCRPISYENNCYIRGQLPMVAGSVLWIYCRQQEEVVQLKTYEVRHQERLDPSALGSLFVGVPSIQPVKVKADGVRSIWQWNRRRFELLQPDGRQEYTLESGKGYLVFDRAGRQNDK